MTTNVSDTNSATPEMNDQNQDTTSSGLTQHLEAEEPVDTSILIIRSPRTPEDNPNGDNPIEFTGRIELGNFDVRRLMLALTNNATYSEGGMNSNAGTERDRTT